jgi:hypothetical protein
MRHDLQRWSIVVTDWLFTLTRRRSLHVFGIAGPDTGSCGIPGEAIKEPAAVISLKISKTAR